MSAVHVLLLLALLLHPVAAVAQSFREIGNTSTFREMHNGGRLDAVALVPGSAGMQIYVGAHSGGVWRTDDGGANWLPLTDREASLGTGTLAIDPTGTHVIAATDDYFSVLLVSHDRGSSWSEQALGHVKRLAFDPEVGGRVFAIAPEGLLRSVDHGDHWEATLELVDDVAVLPGAARPVIATRGTEVLRSSDGRPPFDMRSLPPPPDAAGFVGSGRAAAILATCPGVAGRLYATFDGGGDAAVYRSDDAGDTWTFRGRYDGPLVRNGFACSADGETLWGGERSSNGGGNTQLNRSADGGRTWEVFSGGYHPDLWAVSTDAAPPAVYLGTDGGLYRYDETSGSFTGHNGNIRTLEFNRVAAGRTAPDILLGGTQDNGMVSFRGRWTQIQCGDGADAIVMDRDPHQGLGFCSFGGLVRVDGDSAGVVACFDAVCPDVPGSGLLAHDDGRAGRICAANQGRVKCNDRRGLGAWDLQSPDLDAFDIAFADSPAIWVRSGEAPRIRRSAAGVAGPYLDAEGDLPPERLIDVAVDPGPAGRALALSIQPGGAQVYETRNHGVNWEPLGSPLPIPAPTPPAPCHPEEPFCLGGLAFNWVSAFHVDFGSLGVPEAWFIGTQTGLFESDDRGATWTDRPDVPHVRVRDIRSGPPGIVTVGTFGRGAFQRDGRLRLPNRPGRTPLDPGWGLRVLPELDLPIWASDLFQFAPDLAEIRRIDTPGGRSFRSGDAARGAQDFRIPPGHALLMRSRDVGEIVMNGPPAPPLSVDLIQGWNPVGVGALAGRSASDLVADAEAQGIKVQQVVDSRRERAFVPGQHKPGSAEDFALEAGLGVYLLSTGAGTWTAGAGQGPNEPPSNDPFPGQPGLSGQP